MHSLVTSWLARCGLVALCLNPIDATASTTFAMEIGPMPACGPNSPPWCGRPLIHEPDLQNINRLTPEQIALYLDIAKTGVRLLRDDLTFNEVRGMLGHQIFYDEDANEYTFTRIELKGVLFVVGLVDSAESISNSVDSFDIRVTNRLEGVQKNDLEEHLGLQQASNYVAFSLDPRTDVGFSYYVGRDVVSCYPVSIGLNFFKDEAYATVDPRADREAKYLGPVTMHRIFMSREEKIERAHRIPQCRSRQPVPSGMTVDG